MLGCIATKYYIGLTKGLHHMGEVDYIVSDGYDAAQAAICFLHQFIGRKVSDLYGKAIRFYQLDYSFSPLLQFYLIISKRNSASSLLMSIIYVWFTSIRNVKNTEFKLTSILPSCTLDSDTSPTILPITKLNVPRLLLYNLYLLPLLAVPLKLKQFRQ